MLVLILLAAATAGAAQTAAELRQRYGPPDGQRYTARPGTTVTATFSHDLQACKLVIESNVALSDEAANSNSLPSSAVTEVVNELVPPDQRGRLIDDIDMLPEMSTSR